MKQAFDYGYRGVNMVLTPSITLFRAGKSRRSVGLILRPGAWRAIASLIVALCLSLAASIPVHAGPNKERFAAGRILVTQRNGVTDAQFMNSLTRRGSKDRGRIHATRTHVVDVAPGNEQAAAQTMALDPEVEAAEVDRLVKPEITTANDPYYVNAWHLAKINAPTAWDLSKGNGVTVAVLDSGVDGTHPDLVHKMVPGWNMVDNNSNTSDVYGHGTMVAGVVGAQSNNGLGVTSIAWGASIMPVRVALSTGSAYLSTIAAGIIWAADHGAKIANCSFATLTGSSTIQSAANYMRSKGGLVVVAGGNSGTFDPTPNNSSVISVSATNSSDAIASWSSYGSYIDVAAPGVDIWSTTKGGGYAAVSGTSFATPLTAGVLALMESANPSLTNTVLESLLKNTAVDLGTPGYDSYYGYGRINAGAAVAAAVRYGATTDTTAPTVSISSPTGGTVSSVVGVAVATRDNIGVARVDLYAGSTLVASSNTSPFSLSWNTKTVANGVVNLKAYAYDKAGNKGGSASVAVTVSNATDRTAPMVAVLSPTSGAVKAATVTVKVSAYDNVGVTKVDLYAGSNLIGTTNIAPYNFTWDTTRVANGTINLTAYAYDKVGNKGVSASIPVKVANITGIPTKSASTAVKLTVRNATGDTVAPVVNIVNPMGSSTVKGTVAVTVSGSDKSGIQSLYIYIDGKMKAGSSTGYLNYSWYTGSLAKGMHAITAMAKDAAGNVATKTINVTVG